MPQFVESFMEEIKEVNKFTLYKTDEVFTGRS